MRGELEWPVVSRGVVVTWLVLRYVQYYTLIT